MGSTAELTKKIDEILEKHAEVIKTTDRDMLYAYLEKCLQEDTVLPPSKFMKRNALFYKKLAIFLYKFLVVFLLVLGIGIVSYSSTMEYLEQYSKTEWYEKFSNSFLFESRRWALKLGLQKFDFVKKLYEAECLVENPFLKPMAPSCFCQFELLKHQVKNTEKAQTNFLKKFERRKINPFIVLNATTRPVSFEELRKLYIENKVDITEQGHTFVENHSGSTYFTPDNIFEKQLPPSDHNLEMYFNHVDAARHIRVLFPRLSFIPQTVEVSLGRQLFFNGENASNKPVNIIPRSGSKAAFYIQAWGERNVTVSPKKDCKCKTEPYSTIIHEREALVIPIDLFDVQTAPTSKKGYSLGYLGSVRI